MSYKKNLCVYMSYKKNLCVYMSYKKKLCVYMSFDIKRHIYTSVISWCVSPRPVACAYALIVTVLRALRSVVSRSSETGETFPPSYMCMYSACLVSASCTMVFSQLIHTLKGIHVHYHCLPPLKGNMNVSFGARQRVLNGYLQQNCGECNAHFFASYTVCLARC